MHDRAYIVLNMADSHHWDAMQDGARIPPNRQATVVHHSRTTAEQEALRLHAAHPDGCFVVFESTHASHSITAPTHRTLGGTTRGAQTFAVLLPLEDEVPF